MWYQALEEVQLPQLAVHEDIESPAEDSRTVDGSVCAAFALGVCGDKLPVPTAIKGNAVIAFDIITKICHIQCFVCRVDKISIFL